MYMYHGDASLLTESLELIQRTVAVIISALETDMEWNVGAPENDPGPVLVSQ